jgi:hypothetical protein
MGPTHRTNDTQTILLDRLVLVGSGGLGREVSWLLRLIPVGPELLRDVILGNVS